jgi:predicted  nucleic acid-binding Zn-ribbon protein
MSDISTLRALQRLDAELNRLREDAASVPRAIARLETRVTDAKRIRDAIREAGERGTRDRRERERRVDDLEGERRRFEKQLLEVKKNDEYTALLHEIEARRAAKEEVETAILTMMEAEEDARRALNEAEAVVAKERAAADGEIAVLRRSLAEQEAEIVRLRSEREEIAQTLRPELRARYERILASRGDSAVAEVRRDACSVCYYQIPPQTLTRLKRQEQILECDGCGRILAWFDGTA